MREIKFRAWCEIDKVIIYDLNSPRLIHGELKDDLYELMQYTGLKDNTGKEIYEGDIIEITHPFLSRKWKGKVIYRNYEFTGEGFFFTHFDIPSSLFSEGTEFIEIIGNTHENPELLDNNNETK